MPGVNDPQMTAAEAMEAVVVALESSAENLEPVAAFFETLDRALIEHHSDTDRASFATFVRAYRKAASQIEAESEEEEPEGEGGENGG